MDIKPYTGRTSDGRVKFFSATGPTGTLLIGVTFTDRNRKDGTKYREYQVDEINPGTGWTGVVNKSAV